jgi:hypothetical protein
LRKHDVTAICSSLLLLGALAGSASADDPCDGGEAEGDPCGGDPVAADGAAGEEDSEAMQAPPPEASDGAAMEGAPPMILPTGKLKVNAALGVNMSSSLVAKPIALAPDVYYGVMPKLEVGLVHSNHGLTGFWFQGIGGGVCVTGTESGCAKLYNGPVGVLAHFALMEGNIDLATDAGVVIGSLDPMQLSMKVGVMGRWMSGKINVLFQPAIAIGLTERDTNKEEILIPVTVGYTVSPKLHAGVQTGLYAPLDGLGDFYAIPVGVGAMFMVNDKLGVGGSFNFLNLAGKGGGADFRDLTVFATWHN